MTTGPGLPEEEDRIPGRSPLPGNMTPVPLQAPLLSSSEGLWLLRRASNRGDTDLNQTDIPISAKAWNRAANIHNALLCWAVC